MRRCRSSSDCKYRRTWSCRRNRAGLGHPSTGGVGVIEEIDASIDGRNGCRGFVTSRQSLDGITRFNGFACPSGDSWKLTDR
nr:RT0821/Lpp0805 family surface protein [Rhizobium sp. BK379]